MAQDITSQANESSPVRDVGGDAEQQESLHRWFCFVIAGLDLVVEVDHVRAVTPPQKPYPVPACPSHISGLISYFDEVVPLLNFSTLLDLEHSDQDINGDDLHHCLIVFNAAGLDAAVLSTRARGIVEAPLSKVGPPTLLKGARLRSFLLGEIEQTSGPLGILNLPSLLDAARVAE